jgi:hypothetical protein
MFKCIHIYIYTYILLFNFFGLLHKDKFYCLTSRDQDQPFHEQKIIHIIYFFAN